MWYPTDGLCCFSWGLFILLYFVTGYVGDFGRWKEYFKTARLGPHGSAVPLASRGLQGSCCIVNAHDLSAAGQTLWAYNALKTFCTGHLTVGWLIGQPAGQRQWGKRKDDLRWVGMAARAPPSYVNEACISSCILAARQTGHCLSAVASPPSSANAIISSARRSHRPKTRECAISPLLIRVKNNECGHHDDDNNSYYRNLFQIRT